MFRPRLIKRAASAIGLVLAAAALPACGDESENGAFDLAPGEECISGGLRIVKDGKTTILCFGDADVAVEEVAGGNAGNPCPGDALRVTDRSSGTEVVSWSCATQGLDELLPNELEAFDSVGTFIAMDSRYNLSTSLLCDADIRDTTERAKIDELIEWGASLHKLEAPCRTSILGEIGEVSAEIQAQVDCLFGEFQAESSCKASVLSRDITAEDASECRDLHEAALLECKIDAPTPSACSGLDELEGDALAEFERVQGLITSAIEDCRAF